VTACVLTLSPAGVTGYPLLLFSCAVAGGFWTVVAAVCLVSWRHLLMPVPLRYVIWP